MGREKHGLIFRLMALVLILSAGGVGCNLPGGGGGQPGITINSPPSGDTVAVNNPVTVQVAASDPNGPGIVRVDLFVDGVVVDSFQAGAPESVVGVNLTFTPEAEQAITVTAVAYREDGTKSEPATIALSVVGMTAVAPTADPGTPDAAAAADPTATTDSGPEVVRVKAQATVDINVRDGPGPGCPLIGLVPKGTTIDLLEVTDSPDQYWYKTDFLGEDLPGWVYHEGFELLEDDSVLPVVHVLGCLFCGDTICSPELEETCFNCEQDCGACCGNGTCEPDYGEDCGTCEPDCGPCCGNGVCEAERGEDCGTCETDCGACCGNGTCEPGRGENCNTCETDCGACCGNGVCDYDETCVTCPQDCGQCCGNGTCEGEYGENCNTCPADCGQCCGDGVCDPVYGEDCETCPVDCGACPTCGDGVCNGEEDCSTCPEDCGPC